MRPVGIEAPCKEVVSSGEAITEASTIRARLRSSEQFGVVELRLINHRVGVRIGGHGQVALSDELADTRPRHAAKVQQEPARARCTPGEGGSARSPCVGIAGAVGRSRERPLRGVRRRCPASSGSARRRSTSRRRARGTGRTIARLLAEPGCSTPNHWTACRAGETRSDVSASSPLSGGAGSCCLRWRAHRIVTTPVLASTWSRSPVLIASSRCRCRRRPAGRTRGRRSPRGT